MAGPDEINPDEFALLRRLLANEQPDADETAALQLLTGKRFVRQSQDGWIVTVQGHAAFLHELRKSFERGPDQ